GDVEAHQIGRRLRDAEHIARRQHHALAQGGLRDLGCVAPVGQAAPEIETAAWQRPWADPEAFELADGLAPPLRETAAQADEMLAIAAIAQRSYDELRHHRARAAEIRCDLQIDEAFDPVPPGDDVAAAYRGRKRLREAADTDDAREPVERGEAR